MSRKQRKKAIFLMVLVQFTISVLLLLVLSPVTFAPTSSINEQRVIVLPVYSNETLPETSIGVIQGRMNKVDSYYQECSYSQVSISCTVQGWTRLDSPMDSYAELQSIGGVDHGGVKDMIFLEAILNVDATVDFSHYDRLIVVHAGTSGQDASGNYSKIGTCHTEGWFPTNDGRVFLEASIVSEYDEFGTIAHELGHDFGAPDLYDYHSEWAWVTGIGSWGLMSSGNHNGAPSGTMPSHMCVYNKHLIGWVKDREILVIENDSLTVDLVPVSVQTQGYRAIRYDLGDGTYYLVEARSRVGYDAGLPDSGVLVMLVNETRIEEWRDGVQLQIPKYASWVSDAALREGEVFHDSENRFSVRLKEYGDELVTVDVSTSPLEEWTICERISFSDDVDIRKVCITTAGDDTYVDDTAFAAVFIDDGISQYINVYSSANSGRDWKFMFSTNETDYRLNTWDFSFSYYRGMMLMTGRIYGPESSCIGILGYTINYGAFSLTNLTGMVNHSLWGATASAGPEAFYVCCHSRLNGTAGITYFKLENASWIHSFHPVPNLIEVAVSNVPSVGKSPYVLYRDGNTNLKLVRFNDSEVIHSVDAVHDGVWNFDIVCSRDSILISYLDGAENETHILDTFHVEIGSADIAFSHLVEITREEYLRLVSMSYKNSTDTFYIAASFSGNVTQFIVSGGSVSNRSVRAEGRTYNCIMSSIDYGEKELPLILTYRSFDHSVSSLTWIGCPSNPHRVTAYYFQEQSEFILPIYVFPFLVLCVIIFISILLVKSERVDNVIHKTELHLRLRTFKGQLVSTLRRRTTRFRLFMISPHWLVLNIILGISVFHLAMQLPLIGPRFSHALHEAREVSLLDPISMTISIVLCISFLLLWVDLGELAFRLKWLVWVPALTLILIGNHVAWVALGLMFGALSLWIPLWELTGLQVTHTRWHHLYEATTESIQSIEQESPDDRGVALVIAALDILRKESILLLNQALTDQVVFGGNMREAAESLCELMLGLKDRAAFREDIEFKRILTQLESYI